MRRRATGVTQYQGPEKLWRCDGCGHLYASWTDDDGVTHDFDPAAPSPERQMMQSVWPKDMGGDTHELADPAAPSPERPAE